MMNLNGLRLTQEVSTWIAILCISQFAIYDVQACDDLKQVHTTCGEHGTTIEFADSPADAAKQALESEKLVFVLHVSGNFETPEYT